MRNDSAAAIALIKSGVFQTHSAKPHPKPEVVKDSATLPATGSRSAAQHFSDSLFDTWDTIPEVAFGGSSSGILPASSTGNGSGKTFISGGQSGFPDNQQPATSSGTSGSSTQSKDLNNSLSSAVNNDADDHCDDSDGAIVVYNERTAL